MKGHASLRKEVADLIDSRTFEALWHGGDAPLPSRFRLVFGAVLDVIECRIRGHEFRRSSRPTEHGMEFTYSCARCSWTRIVDC
jgi:hypothetical protein